MCTHRITMGSLQHCLCFLKKSSLHDEGAVLAVGAVFSDSLAPCGWMTLDVTFNSHFCNCNLQSYQCLFMQLTSVLNQNSEVRESQAPYNPPYSCMIERSLFDASPSS